MNYEVKYGPAYALGIVSLEAGEKIQAETGAMVSMSDTIKIETGMKGGLLSGLKRSVLGGESFFLNTFEAEQAGEVTIAPALPGDIMVLELTGQPVLVQSGSFLAATPEIEIDTKWGGGKTFFSREGLFLLRCTGTGTLFLSSYGAIHLVELDAGQRYVVDTGHMVAFDDTVTYDVGRVGSWKSTLLGGEGLVCKLTGPGRFYLQTRNPESFVAWLVPNLTGKRQ
ncbi:MAG: TIGR00266 family protein [Chloroflexi bacterium]|nr:TIGR00266 family protein [Chloroflexota bacterium]